MSSHPDASQQCSESSLKDSEGSCTRGVRLSIFSLFHNAAGSIPSTFIRHCHRPPPSVLETPWPPRSHHQQEVRAGSSNPGSKSEQRGSSSEFLLRFEKRRRIEIGRLCRFQLHICILALWFSEFINSVCVAIIWLFLSPWLIKTSGFEGIRCRMYVFEIYLTWLSFSEWVLILSLFFNIALKLINVFNYFSCDIHMLG